MFFFLLENIKNHDAEEEGKQNSKKRGLGEKVQIERKNRYTW
jgi:hypothetical protein